MSIFDTLIGIIAPHACLGCKREGRLLCSGCRQQLVAQPERCYRCQAFSAGCKTCNACCGTSRLHSVKAATGYTGHAKELVWKLKLGGARSAAKIMAGCLAALVESGEPQPVIVPVPTATGRMRRRGYDQAKLLARELANQTRLPYGDWLARHGQTHQHGLPRRERLAQLQTAFRLAGPRSVEGLHIVLVDDVVTTGATLEAAAAVLLAGGAKRVEAVVFAQA